MPFDWRSLPRKRMTLRRSAGATSMAAAWAAAATRSFFVVAGRALLLLEDVEVAGP